jgi:AraC-like DNA-binding protein
MKNENIRKIIASDVLPAVDRVTAGRVVISQKAHPGIIRNTENLEPMYDLAGHYHHDFELCQVLRNRCLINIEGTVYRLEKGDFCIVPPKTRHSEMLRKGRNNYATIWLFFEGTKLKIHSFTIKGRREMSLKHYSEIELPLPLLHALPYIMERYRNGGEEWAQLAKGFLVSLFAVIEGALKAEKRAPGLPPGQKLLKEALVYLQKNFNRDISLEEIAREMGFSPNYFSGLFKKHTGVSLFEYLNKIRVEKAKQLLRNPRYRIKEISDLIGYNSPYYFSQIFKQFTRVSPEKYRLKIR